MRCTVYIGNFARHATLEHIDREHIIVRMARREDFDVVIQADRGNGFIVDEENNLRYNVRVPAHAMEGEFRVNFARY